MNLKKLEIPLQDLTEDEQTALVEYVKMSLQVRYRARGLADDGEVTEEDILFVLESDLHALIFSHTSNVRREELESQVEEDDTRDFSNFKRKVNKRQRQ